MVLIKIKTILGKVFEVELKDDDAKISTLIDVLSDEHNFEREGMKVVYKGAVAKEEDSLKSIGFDEKTAIMLVAKRKDSLAAKGTEAGVIKRRKLEEEEEVSGEKKEEPASMKVTSFEKPKPKRQKRQNSDSDGEDEDSEDPPMGVIPQEAFLQYMSMFTDSEDPEALRALGDDLYTNFVVDENMTEEEMGELVSGLIQDDDETSDSSSPAQPNSEIETALRTNEALLFEANRLRLSSNPEALQQFLNRIKETNPELFALIETNPQGFLEVINRPVPGSNVEVVANTDPSVASDDKNDSSPPTEAVNEAADASNELTEADNSAISRLMSLAGVSLLEATQAYIAMDKNEEAAANMLFD
eukprot:TRINITY_DN3359_c1_g2_i1.p1 TRINITY_DN3359_c1_g2~~TRINITY_DN3359_c1_g2_i1.p1  ORF type:complete len:378 (+),score=102.19 TRINITY_DN3359_c1_g2_i1:61-1134(+)